MLWKLKQNSIRRLKYVEDKWKSLGYVVLSNVNHTHRHAKIKIPLLTCV